MGAPDATGEVPRENRTPECSSSVRTPRLSPLTSVLHFTYHRRPYAQSGNRTAAQIYVRELRQHLSRYNKGLAGVFEDLEDRLETAKSNAVRARLDASVTRQDNPSTEVHSLVTYL